MRLIDSEELLKLYDKKDWSEMDDEEWDDLRVSLRLVKRNILDMPTIDAVPVVRCRDCVSNYANLIPSEDACCRFTELPITKDFFCPYGERIEE